MTKDVDSQSIKSTSSIGNESNDGVLDQPENFEIRRRSFSNLETGVISYSESETLKAEIEELKREREELRSEVELLFHRKRRENEKYGGTYGRIYSYVPKTAAFRNLLTFIQIKLSDASFYFEKVNNFCPKFGEPRH